MLGFRGWRFLYYLLQICGHSVAVKIMDGSANGGGDDDFEHSLGHSKASEVCRDIYGAYYDTFTYEDDEDEYPLLIHTERACDAVERYRGPLDFLYGRCSTGGPFQNDDNNGNQFFLNGSGNGVQENGTDNGGGIDVVCPDTKETNLDEVCTNDPPSLVISTSFLECRETPVSAIFTEKDADIASQSALEAENDPAQLPDSNLADVDTKIEVEQASLIEIERTPLIEEEWTPLIEVERTTARKRAYRKKAPESQPEFNPWSKNFAIEITGRITRSRAQKLLEKQPVLKEESAACSGKRRGRRPVAKSAKKEDENMKLGDNYDNKDGRTIATVDAVVKSQETKSLGVESVSDICDSQKLTREAGESQNSTDLNELLPTSEFIRSVNENLVNLKDLKQDQDTGSMEERCCKDECKGGDENLETHCYEAEVAQMCPVEQQVAKVDESSKLPQPEEDSLMEGNEDVMGDAVYSDVRKDTVLEEEEEASVMQDESSQPRQTADSLVEGNEDVMGDPVYNDVKKVIALEEEASVIQDESSGPHQLEDSLMEENEVTMDDPVHSIAKGDTTLEEEVLVIRDECSKPCQLEDSSMEGNEDTMDDPLFSPAKGETALEEATSVIEGNSSKPCQLEDYLMEGSKDTLCCPLAKKDTALEAAASVYEDNSSKPCQLKDYLMEENEDIMDDTLYSAAKRETALEEEASVIECKSFKPCQPEDSLMEENQDMMDDPLYSVEKKETTMKEVASGTRDDIQSSSVDQKMNISEDSEDLPSPMSHGEITMPLRSFTVYEKEKAEKNQPSVITNDISSSTSTIDQKMDFLEGLSSSISQGEIIMPLGSCTLDKKEKYEKIHASAIQGSIQCSFIDRKLNIPEDLDDLRSLMSQGTPISCTVDEKEKLGKFEEPAGETVRHDKAEMSPASFTDASNHNFCLDNAQQEEFGGDEAQPVRILEGKTVNVKLDSEGEIVLKLFLSNGQDWETKHSDTSEGFENRITSDSYMEIKPSSTSPIQNNVSHEQGKLRIDMDMNLGNRLEEGDLAGKETESTNSYNENGILILHHAHGNNSSEKPVEGSTDINMDKHSCGHDGGDPIKSSIDNHLQMETEHRSCAISGNHEMNSQVLKVSTGQFNLETKMSEELKTTVSHSEIKEKRISNSSEAMKCEDSKRLNLDYASKECCTGIASCESLEGEGTMNTNDQNVVDRKGNDDVIGTRLDEGEELKVDQSDSEELDVSFRKSECESNNSYKIGTLIIEERNPEKQVDDVKKSPASSNLCDISVSNTYLEPDNPDILFMTGCAVEVNEKLRELRDVQGGIVNTEGAAERYLKLLLVIMGSKERRKERRNQCNTDSLLVALDALLSTKSQTVLTELVEGNVFQMLCDLLERICQAEDMCSLVCKLLKVMEFLAERDSLSKKIMDGIACGGKESFITLIHTLADHFDLQVRDNAHSFQKRWIFHIENYRTNDELIELTNLCENEPSKRISMDIASNYFDTISPAANIKHDADFDTGKQDEYQGSNATHESKGALGSQATQKRERKRKTRWDQPKHLDEKSTRVKLGSFNNSGHTMRIGDIDTCNVSCFETPVSNSVPFDGADVFKDSSIVGKPCLSQCAVPQITQFPLQIDVSAKQVSATQSPAGISRLQFSDKAVWGYTAISGTVQNNLPLAYGIPVSLLKNFIRAHTNISDVSSNPLSPPQCEFGISQTSTSAVQNTSYHSGVSLSTVSAPVGSYPQQQSKSPMETDHPPLPTTYPLQTGVQQSGQVCHGIVDAGDTLKPQSAPGVTLQTENSCKANWSTRGRQKFNFNRTMHSARKNWKNNRPNFQGCLKNTGEYNQPERHIHFPKKHPTTKPPWKERFSSSSPQEQRTVYTPNDNHMLT